MPSAPHVFPISIRTVCEVFSVSKYFLLDKWNPRKVLYEIKFFWQRSLKYFLKKNKYIVAKLLVFVGLKNNIQANHRHHIIANHHHILATYHRHNYPQYHHTLTNNQRHHPILANHHPHHHILAKHHPHHHRDHVCQSEGNCFKHDGGDQEEDDVLEVCQGRICRQRKRASESSRRTQ